MSRRSEDLIAALGVRLLPEPEVRSILARHFPYGAQRDEQVIEYGRAGDVALTARYKGDKLRILERGPLLERTDIEAVAAMIRAEAAETREYVHRTFVFSAQPTGGFWRFGDRFQLVPAPADAPDVAWAMQHPLLLEFKVRRSVDGYLDMMRRTDTETKLVLLLNALLRFGLTHIGYRLGYRWVLETSWPAGRDGPVESRTILASNGYLVPGFAMTADDFTDTGRLSEIPTLGIGESYTGDARQTLQLPSHMGPAVVGYYSLRDPDREVFERSLYWFAHARSMYSVSHSAAFAALVQAIETLAPNASAERCPACGNVPRATANFLEFLMSLGVNKKMARAFYRMRSEILHGGRVLLDDIAGAFSFDLHPGTAEFYFGYDTCERVAKAAMLTWLLRHVDADGSSANQETSPSKA